MLSASKWGHKSLVSLFRKWNTTKDLGYEPAWCK